MKRARVTCSTPGCASVAVRNGRCSSCATPAWHDSSSRRADRGASSAAMAPLRRKVRARARGRCERCGAFLARGDRGVVDHRVPVAEGGPTELDNLWLLCSACDELKTRDDLARMRRAQVAPSR